MWESQIHNNVILCSDARFYDFRVEVHLLDIKQLFNSINVLTHVGHALTATAVLPLCGTCCINLQKQLVHS